MVGILDTAAEHGCPTSKFLTQKEVKFLAEILNDAWYQIDEDNLIMK